MSTPLPPSAQHQDDISREIYDSLMTEIEKDLLLANIPLLDAKYAAETPTEHDARMKRYEVAYKKFEEAFLAFKSGVKSSIRDAKSKELRKEEQQSAREDKTKLDAIAGEF
ncbi:hypothetical protein EXS65_03950 [Candidatus Peribacteria bacterium]|nr:hypothetical protein [Candidatus Peribacteria bacterium]